MRTQPVAFPPPPLPLSSFTPAHAHIHTRPPRMGTFHPDAAPASTNPTTPRAIASAAPRDIPAAPARPPPSRAAAILASQAIRKDAGAGVTASTCTGSGTRSGTTASTASASAAGMTSTSGSSRRTSAAAAKDTKRRATHSQIERRRREKINDRLITLRNLVPACNEELAARQRLTEAGQPANAASPTANGVEDEDTVIVTAAAAAAAADGTDTKRKRKRTKRKAVEEVKDKDKDAEPELGMHKLDVLTHTIDYIYQLHARIEELEMGQRPVKTRRRDRDDTVEDAMQATPHGPPLGPGLTASPQQLIDEKPPRGFTPIKLGGRSCRDPSRARSMSASSETASEADFPPPLFANCHGSGSGSGSGYDYSPPFPAGASSCSSSRGANTPASSALSSITSPFMSLSASSPIFLAGSSGSATGTGTGTGAGKGGGGFGGFGGGSRKSLDTMGAAPCFALPPAALSLYEIAHHHHHHHHHHQHQHGEMRGQHGSTSSVRDGGSQEEEEEGKVEGQGQDSEMVAGDEYAAWQQQQQQQRHRGSDVDSTNRSSDLEPEAEASSAARLLLAISASPEDALRPIGYHSDPRSAKGPPLPASLPRVTRRSTTTSFHLDRPEMGQRPSAFLGPHSSQTSTSTSISAGYASAAAHCRRWIPGSAPGGSRATTSDFTGGAAAIGRQGFLPSPPLLALDDQARQGQSVG